MDNEKRRRLELMKRILPPISRERLQKIVRARVPEAIKLELLKMSERRTDAEIRQGFADGRIAEMTPHQAGEQLANAGGSEPQLEDIPRLERAFERVRSATPPDAKSITVGQPDGKSPFFNDDDEAAD